jgi:putative spermidine/putrescine transport system substrate-binding protein
MKRRDFLKVSVVAIGALAMNRAAMAQDSQELIFNGAGGTWQDNARKSWLTPFSEKAGVKVIDTFPFDIGKLQAMVKTNTTAWDLTDIPAAQVGLAVSSGLTEPIDYKIVQRAGLPADLFGDHYVVYSKFSTNLVYNSKKYGERKPASWADFWDVQKFPGPRSMRKHPSPNLELALIADGVPLDKLYPLDVDRAFKKLDQLKPDIRWWTAGGQSVDLMTSGEADMGTMFHSRFYAIQNSPLEMIWNQSAHGGVYFVVPKGAKNKEAAMKLVDFILQPESQARMAINNGSSPANPAAFALIPADRTERLPTSPQNAKCSFQVDEAGYWAKELAVIQKRFDAWVLA